jgi:hypothetical protein
MCRLKGTNLWGVGTEDAPTYTDKEPAKKQAFFFVLQPYCNPNSVLPQAHYDIPIIFLPETKIIFHNQPSFV